MQLNKRKVRNAEYAGRVPAGDMFWTKVVGNKSEKDVGAQQLSVGNGSREREN